MLTKRTGEAQQFFSKREAQIAAQQIGWNKSDVVRIDSMGFLVWVISDPHMNFVSRKGFQDALRNRDNKAF